MRDRVIVERDEDQLLSPGGYVIKPETTVEKPAQGTVVDVGDGRVIDSGVSIPISIGVGDRVMFAKYAGVEVEIDNKEYTILREDEVIGVFKKTAKEDVSA